MSGMLNSQLIGNLGKEPEMRYTPNGKPVTTFSVACNQNHTDRDGNRVEDVEWVRVQARGKLAEICNQYLHKGNQVYITGRLEVNRWQGQDGATHADLQVTATEMVMLGSRSNGERGGGCS